MDFEQKTEQVEQRVTAIALTALVVILGVVAMAWYVTNRVGDYEQQLRYGQYQERP